MAVSKLWPVTVRLATVLDYASNPEKTTKSKSKYSDADYQALRDVVAYAKDEEKTERELFCAGIHCNPQTAREQFITVKEQFDKPDGIQAYHGYLSFEKTDITPELAQQVGMAFAERMWGDRFQVLVTTHLNTEHLHCHFVVNSVSFRDGKRLQNKEKAWWYFRHIADEVCLEHGLSVVQNPEAYQSPHILTQKDKAGMPTRYNLARAALDEAIAMSHNLRQLEYHLSEMGYALGSNPKRKYWTIKGKGDERPIRLHRLGEEYTKERITQRLIENRDNIDFEPFQPKTYRPKQYRLRTRSDRIGKVGGLYGLYLYYRKVIWQCKLGHEWTASVKSRTVNGTGCPYCSHNFVLPGFNDLASCFPEIATEWSEHNLPLTPDQVTAFKNIKVWWKCCLECDLLHISLNYIVRSILPEQP